MITGLCCTLMWWRSFDRFGKLGLIAAAGVISVGVYCTLTRSVWLALIIAAGWFIWIPVNRRAKGVMAVGALLVGLSLMPVLGEKIFSFKRDKEVTQNQMEKSAQMRPLFAIVAMNMFADRPFLGCGFGQYSRAKYPYLQDPHSGQPLAMTKSLMQHNVFLAYLTETGLLGLMSLLIALAVMIRGGLIVWMNTDLPFWPRQFGLLLMTVISCYAVNGMFHDVSIIPMANMLLFFLAGIVNNLVSGQWQFDREAVTLQPTAALSPQSNSAAMG
jgi:O-antigen ligase